MPFVLRGKTAFALAVLVLAVPAAAQFSDEYNFLKAVKERKSEVVEKYIAAPGSNINTTDDSTGETALHIVTKRRDSDWLSFLLGQGAKPSIADKNGVTPLMLAVQLGWPDGASLLLRLKADVDATNKSGETALIRAVQLRKPEMVRLLMKAGANADKQDNVAGYSARDYAAQDGRASAILAILDGGWKDEAPAKEDESKSGDLDFSGIEEKPASLDKLSPQ